MIFHTSFDRCDSYKASFAIGGCDAESDSETETLTRPLYARCVDRGNYSVGDVWTGKYVNRMTACDDGGG